MNDFFLCFLACVPGILFPSCKCFFRIALSLPRSCRVAMKLPLFASSQAKSTLSSWWTLNGNACFARNSTAVTISRRIVLFSSPCSSCCFRKLRIYSQIRFSRSQCAVWSYLLVLWHCNASYFVHGSIRMPSLPRAVWWHGFNLSKCTVLVLLFTDDWMQYVASETLDHCRTASTISISRWNVAGVL